MSLVCRRTVFLCTAMVVAFAWRPAHSHGSSDSAGDAHVPSRIERVAGECMMGPLPLILEAGAACYYLFPYNLHLVVGDTATLRVVDESGTTVPGVMSFWGYDMSLISVTPSGLVTALRTEEATEIGTWVSVTLDGQSVANTCIVRVLESSIPHNYVTAESDNTILYYPEYVHAEFMTTYVEQYQMATIHQYTYDLQTGLMGTQPFGGCKQVLQVDFGESETQRVCGISGNPLRLGWNITGNAWQNCFLVPFVAPRSPQWFVIAHEIGHNTTWASVVFGQGLYAPAAGGSGDLITYSEGVASIIAAHGYERMLADSEAHPMGYGPTSTIRGQNDMYRSGWESDLQNWLASGAPIETLGAGEVCAIWLRYDSLYSGDFGARFFRGLQPQNYAALTPVLLSVRNQGHNGVHTFFAALMSAAFEQDLSSEFAGSYNYPIISPLFDSAYTALLKIMGLTCYLDADGDTYGDEAHPVECFTGDCSCQPGLASNHADCDDSNPDIHFLAEESCNGIDDNCDGQADEGPDDDGDGISLPCDNCIGFATPGNASIMTGDVNLDASLTSADIIYDVNYVFKTGPVPRPCAASADVNCDNAVSSADIIYMVNHVFKGGLAPCDVCVEEPGSTLCGP